MINLSRVAHSGYLSQPIKVLRTKGQWVKGRWEMVGDEELIIRGIVTQATPKDLQQVPEGDRVTGSIKLITVERLYPTDRKTGLSDYVLWRKAKYRIITTTPDVDYGFNRSIGTRIEGDGVG